jgi:hypothetical protein
VDVDSITTRVTPRPYSQSASSSSDLVVVANVRTSWRRRPGLASCGTRTHATSVALPISSAATRSTSSAGSSMTSSTATILSVLTGFQAGRPQEPTGTQRGGIACSTATMQDPWQQLPASDTVTGSSAPSTIDVGERPDPIFTPAGRHRRDTHDTVALAVGSVDVLHLMA